MQGLGSFLRFLCFLWPSMPWSGSGLIDGLFQVARQTRTEDGEVFHGFQRDELIRQVADDRSFKGEGMHREAGGVGGGLAKEAVLGTSADHEDSLEGAAGE